MLQRLSERWTAIYSPYRNLQTLQTAWEQCNISNQLGAPWCQRHLSYICTYSLQSSWFITTWVFWLSSWSLAQVWPISTITCGVRSGPEAVNAQLSAAPSHKENMSVDMSDWETWRWQLISSVPFLSPCLLGFSLGSPASSCLSFMWPYDELATHPDCTHSNVWILGKRLISCSFLVESDEMVHCASIFTWICP